MRIAAPHSVSFFLFAFRPAEMRIAAPMLVTVLLNLNFKPYASVLFFSSSVLQSRQRQCLCICTSSCASICTFVLANLNASLAALEFREK
jgi:hypothetical protein